MTIESTRLINLDDFRADPRFKDIDGRGHAVVTIDDAFDLDHPFFGPGTRTDENGILLGERIVYQYDFADDDIDANPNKEAADANKMKHGTHVASIAVSSDTTHRGMAPGANIILLKHSTYDNSKEKEEDRIFIVDLATEKALQWVEDNANTYNIASVNMSFGDGFKNNHTEPQVLSPYGDELERLANLGVILVSTTGNNFNTHKSVQGEGHPGAHPDVLSVGSVFDSIIVNDKGQPVRITYTNDFPPDVPPNERVASMAFSTDKDRIVPSSQRHGTMTTIFAPGSEITAADVGGGVRVSDGTSQAAPHIAGIAALAQQLAMQELGRKLTPTEFADLLRDTGVTITDGDDEDDNVINTGLDFKRVDVHALGKAIYSLDFLSNAFYEYDVILQTGNAQENREIQKIERPTSINDSGQVVVIGDFDTSVFGQNAVFLSDKSGNTDSIFGGNLADNFEFSPILQINDNGKIITHARRNQVNPGSTPTSLIRLYHPGGSVFDTSIATAGGSFNSNSPTYPFDFHSIEPRVTVNNKDEIITIASTPVLNFNQPPSPPYTFTSVGDRQLITTSLPIDGKQQLLTRGGVNTYTNAEPMIDDDGVVITVEPGVTGTPTIAEIPRGTNLRRDILPSVPETVLDPFGRPVTIRRPMFRSVGANPGVSDDGKIVAFTGDRGNGAGVFLIHRDPKTGLFDPNNPNTVIRVAGEYGTSAATLNLTPDLGYDALGNPLYFQEFDFNSRVGVTNYPLRANKRVKDNGQTNPNGLVDDSVVVTFLGTPSAASRDNPQIDGTQPLFFSQEKGLWRVRVDFEENLSNRSVFSANPTGAIPVVQIGDMIKGQVITDLAVHDPISNATKYLAGNPRTQQLGDHRIAFWAKTNTGEMVVRAEHLDSDQDGLLDHWETHGIDINNDGVIDLDLAEMGAHPMKKDIFLEIDWVIDQTDEKGNTLWSNAPNEQALQDLVDMFAKAPVTNPDGTTGISLHIDAGPGLSVNMGTDIDMDMEPEIDPNLLDGGSLIEGTDNNDQERPDVVYFGKTGRFNINGEGPRVRSLHSIKDQYFGNNNLRARELAFHYTVFADFSDLTPFGSSSQSVTFTPNVRRAGNYFDSNSQARGYLLADSYFSTPENGGTIHIIEGKGKGQMRTIIPDPVNPAWVTLDQPWDTDDIPDDTSKFVRIAHWGGQGEVQFRASPDLNAIPGNDGIVSLRNSTSLQQFRVLAHELGHNLGLREGGTDLFGYKPKNDYKSLMSYSHGIPPHTLKDFSGDRDNTFDDWANIKPDFFNSSISLGNSFNMGSGLNSNLNQMPYINGEALARGTNPRPEYNRPIMTIASLSSDTTLPVGSDLTITLTVTDDSGVDTVNLSFDVNGDGDTDDAGEFLQASLIAPDTFEATFTDISGVGGADGVRSVVMIAEDIHENAELQTLDITPTGTNRQDNLLGTSNDDVLIGMSGADNLTGNGGSDTFVYKSFRDGIDTITDFGVDDFIDLSEIFAGQNYGSSTPFEDYVELAQVGADTQVRINPVGDMLSGVFSNLITLENVTANDLNASNILV
ncbi:MAG: S8 family serine peptidase [Crocosphaera sp.]